MNSSSLLMALGELLKKMGLGKEVRDVFRSEVFITVHKYDDLFAVFKPFGYFPSQIIQQRLAWAYISFEMLEKCLTLLSQG